MLDDGDSMTVPFSVQIVVRDQGPGVWKTARVDIFDGNDAGARQIGSYERNHSGWCAETFAPFMLDGRWFALYAHAHIVQITGESYRLKDKCKAGQTAKKTASA